MRFRIGDVYLAADSAQLALDTDVARAAPLGAELGDERGTVLARRERVWIECTWLETWQPTDAWNDEHAPLRLGDLAELLDDESDPVFLADSADCEHTPPGPQTRAQALGGRATTGPANSPFDSRPREHASSASPTRAAANRRGEKETSAMANSVSSVESVDTARAVEVEIESYRELAVATDVDAGDEHVALRDDDGQLFVVSRRAFAAGQLAKTSLASIQGA